MQTASVLKPGDDFPRGKFLYGWKLNDNYEKDSMYVVYEPTQKRQLKKAPVRYELQRTFPIGHWVKAFIANGTEPITEVWFFTKRGAQRYASRASSR
jgi:hypothetical protein